MDCGTDVANFEFSSPDEAVDAVRSRLASVDTESMPLSNAVGRILAKPLLALRDSPACDVSAMDGFACRVADWNQTDGSLPIAGEARIGGAPRQLEPGTVLRIFTGSAVPHGADAVVKREDVVARDSRLRLNAGLVLNVGDHIRRQAENGRSGAKILDAGETLHAAAIAAAASIGVSEVPLYRRVRVSVLVTGDEISAAGSPIEPWRLFDSNGPTLTAIFGRLPWIDLRSPRHVCDEPSEIMSALTEAFAVSDAIIATGGVSVGDYDFLPDAVRKLGGQAVFHGLPTRPGKPVLAALCRGKPVFALPGNPVSLMVSARWLVVPSLRTLAGSTRADTQPCVAIKNADVRTLPLYWFRPVRFIGSGEAELAANVSSGDVVGPAASDGFIRVPPGKTAVGTFPFYSWAPT